GRGAELARAPARPTRRGRPSGGRLPRVRLRPDPGQDRAPGPQSPDLRADRVLAAPVAPARPGAGARRAGDACAGGTPPLASRQARRLVVAAAPRALARPPPQGDSASAEGPRSRARPLSHAHSRSEGRFPSAGDRCPVPPSSSLLVTCA